MIIKSITLTNFRNHHQYHLECNPDTTLILGRNGYGKTSILEAIYILTRGKSFRATDQDILKRGEDFYRIEMQYNNGEKIIATFDGKIKTFNVLDKKVRRLPKNNKYPTVLFLPSDLNLVSGSPSRRREYFNQIFGQISEEYSNNVSRYEKALHQRNELLKNSKPSSATLFSWNLLLAKYGSAISKMRLSYTDEINKYLGDMYYSIAENDDKVLLKYITDSLSEESKYLGLLEKNLERDLILGHTTFGVHKDNFDFIFNNKTANGSASRGETRSIILALKFIEAKLLHQKFEHPPIILLDDVFSELDAKRRECLISNFKNNQVIITSVEEINY